ncbi:hypothetical protein J3E74DRAFT_46385 [Bipolaris maydis]|nr:hypothetical protein J3E74DRAFT_46385 [Bipolaris maydis]
MRGREERMVHRNWVSLFSFLCCMLTVRCSWRESQAIVLLLLIFYHYPNKKKEQPPPSIAFPHLSSSKPAPSLHPARDDAPPRTNHPSLSLSFPPPRIHLCPALLPFPASLPLHTPVRPIPVTLDSHDSRIGQISASNSLFLTWSSPRIHLFLFWWLWSPTVTPIFVWLF